MVLLYLGVGALKATGGRPDSVLRLLADFPLLGVMEAQSFGSLCPLESGVCERRILSSPPYLGTLGQYSSGSW